ncbi:glycosyltransferase family 2 protein [Catenovulum sp. SM1970]|uniref:glycosyltransferase n=1 Tax=Marinifaba aquimaris TaxID=2741323 RepID=UPI0015718A30|nr:glycosyltransferase family A protein [Marinifaba aquimaris]NTS78272.1 glycosyltransferase family 2 protein [Marinifaba aquimaris]
MSAKKVSFIIPHKGRLEMLSQTVLSILNLDYHLSAIEVIVVSQNERLDASEIIDKNTNGFEQVQVFLRKEGGTISASRNFGVTRASGEYLAFLDADIDLSSNWLNIMFEKLAEKPDRKLVSAYQICHQDAPELEKLRTELSNFDVDQAVSFLPGRNLFLTRDTFDKVNGFPEHLITCEDYYFTDKVNELGELFYTTDASYVHLGEDKEWGQLFDKEIWRGQSNLKSLKGRSIPVREYPSLLVPLWVFLFGLGAIIALFFGNIPAVVSNLVAVLLPVFAYSYRLFSKTEARLSFYLISKFYSIYFVARAIGTVMGVVKAFNVRNGA